MKTRIHIVSGFLGAGKTTFIKRLLAEKAFGEAPMLIENDYGSLGIDGAVMEETGIQVVEMNSGCICCSLVGSFTQALEQIYIQYQPEDIIIEPSGVGKLSEIRQATLAADSKYPLILEKCVTVVDAKKFDHNEKYVTEYFEDQIRSADVVVLSKTAKLSDEKITDICLQIHKINSQAITVSIPWEDQSLKDYIYPIPAINSSLIPNCLAPSLSKFKAKMQDTKDTSLKQSDFESVNFDLETIYKDSELNDIFEKLEDAAMYGNIFRAKGVIETESGKKQVDYVSGDLKIVQTNLKVTNRILFIGKRLNRESLAQLLGIMGQEAHYRYQWLTPGAGRRRKNICLK